MNARQYILEAFKETEKETNDEKDNDHTKPPSTDGYRRAKNRATIRKQLAYIRRDINYLENHTEESYAPTSKEISLLMTIYKQYE